MAFFKTTVIVQHLRDGQGGDGGEQGDSAQHDDHELFSPDDVVFLYRLVKGFSNHSYGELYQQPLLACDSQL